MPQDLASEQEIHEAAMTLFRKYGASAQNVAARELVSAATANDLGECKRWLEVRRVLFRNKNVNRYTRRLSDKLIWAIEQSFEMNLPHLAAVLGVIAAEAQQAEKHAAADLRHLAGGGAQPPDGGANPDTPEYTRRLSDKLIWALSQSVDQGKMDIAARLKPIYEVTAEGDAARAAAYVNRR